MSTVEVKLMRIQMETRTLLGIRIETYLFYILERWLCFLHILSNIELKCYGLIWWRKFQNTIEFSLWHSYCYLLLARLIVRIKKKSRKIFLSAVWSEV